MWHGRKSLCRGQHDRNQTGRCVSANQPARSVHRVALCGVLSELCRRPLPFRRSPMYPHLLPATAPDDVTAWQQTVLAFLAEKERRSGSRRTVEGYARMLWPFLGRVGSPDRVTPAHVLAWAYGIGASGREPSSTTVGARIACLSSYYRFLIRMNIASANPCDALERPKTVSSPARGLTAEQIRQLLAVVPDTVAGRRDRALLLTFVLTGL